ncbi:CPBP family intramembrane glutamic endopeptidase [Flaviaesturariibacter amylovorans]|uniref:CAAX prenyl protease 2/Lysostaphin resistance protein A-like domain-containing protein n=1 Tax=Flaviaesturariibacter amylovorans TaxID=1084520 RepID=A0ABP8HUV7_9BACT
MQTYLKTRPIGVQLLFFVGMAVGIFMIVFFFGGMILAQITGIKLLDMGNYKAWNPNDPAVLSMLRGTFLLQFLGLFLIPSFLFAKASDPRPGQYLGLRAPSHAGYWLLAVVALLVAIPLVEYTGLLNKELIQHSPFQKKAGEMEESAARALGVVLKMRTIGDLLLNLVFIAVFAGVGEELFFRGIVQRLFIKGTRSPWAGILIAAFLFSFFHMQFYGFLPRFLLGILLGAAYWYSGSLWPSIFAHFFYDALFITIAYFKPETVTSDAPVLQNSGLMLPVALISAALTGLLVWLMRRQSDTRFEAVYADELRPQPAKDLRF